MFTYRRRLTTTRIILHDSHTPATIKDVTAWLLVEGRVRGLLTVGYHYVIERDGRVRTTRDPDSVGSHLRHHNHDSVGVCLAGGGEGAEDVTAEQKESLKTLHVLIGRGLPLVGHNEVTGRGKCPCFNMKYLRGELMDVRQQEAPLA